MRLRVGTKILIFLFLNQNICCGYSKEPSQWDGSLCTQNICSNWWIIKYLQFYAQQFCLSKPIYTIVMLQNTDGFMFKNLQCLIIDEAKSGYQNIDFLISEPKHMLWVLKWTVSMRLFFWAPKTYVQAGGLEKIYNFTLKNFVYLKVCILLSCCRIQVVSCSRIFCVWS